MTILTEKEVEDYVKRLMQCLNCAHLSDPNCNGYDDKDGNCVKWQEIKPS